MQKVMFGSMVMIAFIAVGMVMSAPAADSDVPMTNGDALFVQIYDRGFGSPRWMLYDPADHSLTPIFTDRFIAGVWLSVDGRIAYSQSLSGVYVLDDFADKTAFQVSETGVPIAWSEDGTILAFATATNPDSHDARLRVWDGIKTIDISPPAKIDPIDVYNVQWSDDGQLAFTATSQNPEFDDLYVWDGERTFNVSQTPDANESSPSWSTDGQLAFVSRQADKFDLYVWDGVSMRNGLPDRETFTDVMPNLTGWYSGGRWTPDNRLVFSAFTGKGGALQSYVWDGENSVVNISQIPNRWHSGGGDWSADGRWAFTTFFSEVQILVVRNTQNETVFIDDGQYGAAWSADGALIYCRYAPYHGWELRLWEGKAPSIIVRGNVINAQWQSGGRVGCSSG